MKSPFLIITALMALAFSMAYATTELKTDNDKLSYTIGNNMGLGFKQQELAINTSAFMQGLQDSLNGAKPALNSEEQKKIIDQFQKQLIKKAQLKIKEEARVNAAAGKKFLTANAKKPGIKTTKSGLQYQVIEIGKGPKPASTDMVTVDYEGKLINGSIFDSSYERGKSVTFPVNAIIPGWSEALQMMPVGSTWTLYIPAELAYGEQGAPGAVGPQQTLVFKVHLISTEKPSTNASKAVADN